MKVMSALAVQIVLLVTAILYVLCSIPTATSKLCERILYGVYAFVCTVLIVVVHIVAQ